MYRFSGTDIELTRGDSLVFHIRLSGRDLPPGTLALFSVKPSPKAEAPTIEKQMPVSGGVVLIGLSSADTNVAPRSYCWDLRVMIPLGDGTFEVLTPMEYATFQILEVIGNV